MKKILVILSFVCVATAVTAQSATDLQVDTAGSSIKWDARKVVGGHVGTINIKEGSVRLDGNRLIGGSFVIDMPSLVCTDAARVTAHLKNADFFDVEKFPTSTFVLTKVDQGNDGPLITGKLTMKGITKDISFPARVSVSGNQLRANATVRLNRIDFDIKYRSGSFFADLGNRAIEDEFTLEINLVARQI